MERKKAKNFFHALQREQPAVNILAGRNAVVEALKAGRGMNRVYLAEGMRPSDSAELVELAKERGVPYVFCPREKLDALSRGLRHQGVAAEAAPVDYVSVEDILARAEEKGEAPFLLLLDELEDPHNLGALLRTADATGVHGVLIPKRRSVPLNGTVAKTSAGAVEYVPVARIGNVRQTIDALKEKGIWVFGADMDGAQEYDEADFTGPMLLVVGNEGHGMTRLVKEACDVVVRLPMAGKLQSLNASVAGSILLYEAFRQRRKK